jgi:hypothetical protein
MEVFGLPWGVDDACTAASLQAFGSIIAMRSWCLVLMMIAVPHQRVARVCCLLFVDGQCRILISALDCPHWGTLPER